MATQAEILTLIYKTEYYVINKDYKASQDEEYGIDADTKSINKIKCLRLLLKALKTQYILDYTADICTSLYIKVKENVGLDLQTVPAVNTNLVIYSANNISDVLIGSIILATYQELLDNLEEDADHVISVKVFNEFINHLDLSLRIYRAIITISDGLVITHNLGTEFVSVQFYDSVGPIMCNFEITNSNSITLDSNVTISNVHVVILG